MTIAVHLKIAGRAWTKRVVIEEPNRTSQGARYYATDEEAVQWHYRRYRDWARTTVEFLNRVGISAEAKVTYVVDEGEE